MKIGVQRDGAAADGEAKIWGVGGAVDDDLIESAVVFSGRGKRSADALDGGQVRILECVGSAHWRIARALRLPRAKRAAGNDVAHGFGVGEVGIEMHGRARADVGHFQAGNVEFEGQLARLERVDDELRVLADQVTDGDFDFSVLGRHGGHLAALFARGQIEDESGEVDGVDVFGRAEEIVKGHAEREFPDLDQRLNSWLAVVGIQLAEDPEACSGNAKTLEEGDLQGIQLDAALESGGERIDDDGAQGGLGAGDHDGEAREGDDGDESEGGDPAPTIAQGRALSGAWLKHGVLWHRWLRREW